MHLLDINKCPNECYLIFATDNHVFCGEISQNELGDYVWWPNKGGTTTTSSYIPEYMLREIVEKLQELNSCENS